MRFKKVFIFLFLLTSIFSSRAPGVTGERTYKIFRGVSHVHTQFSHDSSASLDLLIEKAAQSNFDFVIVTDHNSMGGLSLYQKMRRPERPLLIFGDEISAPDGHLIALGIPAPPTEEMSSQKLIDWIHTQGGYAIIPHPFGQKNPWKNWDVKGWDGLEVYNFGHELHGEGGADFAMEALFGDPRPELKSLQKVSEKYFSFWDDALKVRPVAGLGGTDAHMKCRPEGFLAALESVTLYVIADTLEENKIVKAVGTGRAFMAFETRGIASEFLFWAETNEKTVGPGETLEVQDDTEISFHVRVPVSAKIKVIYNGSIVVEEEAGELNFSAGEAGAYRIEVYQGRDLWIFSNPIYLSA